MASESSERALQGYARFAGFMYVFSMAVFIVCFVMVSGFVVKGDFTQTAANIMASVFEYRLALILRLVGELTLVALGWGFYLLLKPVDAGLSLFALLLRLVQAGIGGVGAIIQFAALDNYLAAAHETGARALASKFASSAHLALSNIQFVYLALTSILVFYLLYKSRFMPRLISGFSLLAAVLFGVQTIAHILLPEQEPFFEMLISTTEDQLGASIAPSTKALVGQLENLPMFFAEVGTGLWLLVFGANTRFLARNAK